MNVETPITLDLLDTPGGPALSSTSDFPVIETKPDAQNEGSPPDVPAAPEEEQSESERQPEGSATSATEEAPAEPAKKESRGVQKALDRLTAEREEQRRLAEQEREARIRLEERLKLLEERTPEPEPTTDDAPVKPNRADYADPDAWEQAIIDYADKAAAYNAEKAVKAAREEEKAAADLRAIEDGQRVAREAFEARVQKAKEKHADFDQVASNPDVQVSMPMAHAIIHSEHGPDIQYYLGKNPDEAKRIMALAPPLQLVELGFIVRDLTRPVEKPPVSAAPRPIRPVTPTSEVQKSLDDMSMDEYVAARKAQRH